MNHVYRLARGHANGQWVAVPETSKAGRGGKSSSRRLAAAAAVAALASAAAQAGPTGGQVQAGNGNIAQSGKQTTVLQTSPTLSLNWQGFNVAADERVNFVQPSAAAIAVNRIVDPQGSQILGRIDANGQVWLINPNGILFGRDAQINVGGLVASTLAIGDDSLGADSRRFGGTGTGSIVNQGTITAAEGGYVALLGHSVINQGSISARLGTVALGAGSAATLSFAGSRLLSLQVDANLIESLADNGGLIRADGGQVLMSAGARDSLLASVVNNTGVIQAQTVEQQAGRIVLLGGMAAGAAQVAGTLDASAPNGGAGGFVETSAAKVTVADAARVTTAASQGRAGNWLIDPVDFTIAASGGDISGTTLSANLAGGDVTIQSTIGASGTAGDVNVNAAVAWSANKLTLSAQNNINLNAALTGTGTASLALEYGQGALAAANTSDYLVRAAVTLPAGTNFSTKLGSNGTTKSYTVITTLGAAGSTTTTDLQGMTGGLSYNYALGADIDASSTSAWNAGAGFDHVGTSATAFTGTLAGLGHAIDSLTVNRPSSVDVGMFGYVSSAALRDLSLRGGSIAGGTVSSDTMGALVGTAFSTTISNVSATTTVSGGQPGSTYVGGLVGRLDGASVLTRSSATGTVTGQGYMAGGLVGYMGGTSSFTDSFATGNVTGPRYVGGLVGYANGPSNVLTRVYATGRVIATSGEAGGLAGNSGATVSLAYATGAVSGTGSVGGLIGTMSRGAVSDSYAKGDVTASGSVSGGLVGRFGSFSSSTITRSYATGTAIATSAAGGLVGSYSGTTTITSSYWNSSGNSLGIGSGTKTGHLGLTASQLTVASNFSGLNFTTNWVNYDGYSTPLLRNFLTPLTVTASTGSKTYDGLAPSGVSYSVAPNATLLGSLSYVCNPVCAADVGSYAVTLSGLYSTSQQGYLISYANGTQTINKAPLTVSAVDQSRVYGQTNPPLTVAISGFVNGETASTAAGYGGSGSASTTATPSTGAGTATITASAGSLTASNYDFTNLVDGTLTITKAPLTVTAAPASKTYDGLAFTGGNGAAYSGFVNGESSAVLGGALSYVGSSQGAVNAGSYTITPQGLASSNYQIGYADGTLSVAKAALTITADNKTKTYGQANPAFTTTISGFVNGESAATALGFGGSGSATSTATALTGAGTAAITASAGSLTASNYDFSTLVDGTLTIAKAPLTVTAAPASKTYDGLTFAGGNGVAYSGFVNGESSTALGGALAYTGNSQGAIDAGNYTIAPQGLASSNYQIGYANGTLSVAKAPLTVTADNKTKTYGQANPVFTTTISGFVNGESAATALGFGGSGSATSTATALTGTGTAAITASAGSLTASNYDFTNLVDGTLTITKAPLTVTAAPASKTYDGLAFTGGNGAAYSGFVNGESSAVLGGALSYVGSSQGAVNAGSYTITPQGLASSNYQIGYADGTLSVAKAALTITADNKTKTYGQANPAFTTTISGFVNGESAATALGFGGSGSATSTATALTGAGTAAITASAGSLTASNYDFSTLVDGTLTIAKAPLTVTAAPASKTYDGLAFSGGNGVAYSGLVNGDSGSALGGTLAYAGSAQGAVNAGSYTITPLGLASSNYQISYADGGLNIGKALLSLSHVSASSKVYDGNNVASIAVGPLAGLVGGQTLQLSTAATFDTANAGTAKTVTVSYALADGSAGGLVSNYRPDEASFQARLTASITPASLSYVAAPASSFSGAQPVGLTGQVNGWVAGESQATATLGSLVWSTPADTTSPPGRYAIHGGGLSAANYLFVQDPGNGGALTVQPGTVPEIVRAALAPGAGTKPPSAAIATDAPAPLSASAALPAASPGNTAVVATAVRIGGPNGPVLQRQGTAVRLPNSLREGTEE